MSRGLQRLLAGLAVVAMSSTLLTSPASAAKPTGGGGGGGGKKKAAPPPAEAAPAATVGEADAYFTCRAALARLEGAGLLSGVHAELFTANPEPEGVDPEDVACATDFAGIQASVNAQANLFTHKLLFTDLLKVDVKVLYGGTQLLVDNQFTTELPVAGMAEAGVALLKISVLGVAIDVAVLTSEAEASCDNSQPVLKGSSRVVGLKIDGVVKSFDLDVSRGKHLHVALAATLAAQVEVKALLGHLLATAELEALLQAGLTLHLNHQETVFEGDSGKLTQQALVLESGLIGKVIVSESIADYHGNPCTTTTGPPPPSAARGWMTGGGRINAESGRVTHGFRLECTPVNGGNNLQVSYAGGGFHATGDFVATCDNGSDGQNDSGNPKAGFDTLVGTAKGRCNNQDAWATYTLTDQGEPGTADTFRIDITGAAPGCTLTASGALDRGNHQAHGRP